MTRLNITRVFTEENDCEGLFGAIASDPKMNSSVNVTVSQPCTDQIPLSVVIDQKKEQQFLEVAKDDSGSMYVEITFSGLYVRLTGYTLLTAPRDRDSAHPKTWRLLGYAESGGETKEYVIDEVVDSVDMNKYFHTVNRSVKCIQYYNRLRLQVDDTWSGSSRFILSRIELYGNLLEQRQ